MFNLNLILFFLQSLIKYIIFIFVLTYLTFPIFSIIPTYDRKDWKHWTVESCRNTRNIVLIRDSLIPVTYKTSKKCKVATGEWLCPYIGKTRTVPKKIDIDHHVPLKNAHLSGGYAWSRNKKRKYANDLSNGYHLIAICAGSNRKKGAKGPEEWLPDKKKCTYVKNWLEVKNNYKLSINPKEKNVIDDIILWCKNNVHMKN